MDKPTSITAVLMGLAAGIIATAQPPDHRTAEAAGAAAAAASAASAASPACAKRAPGPNIAPAAVAPTKTPDVLVDADGMNRAGGVGSLPSNPRGDPCASVTRPPRAPSAAG